MNTHILLVVDDTPHILKLSKEIFEIAGFKVITAQDGEQALRLLAEKKIDLVVTDILMPNTDGYLLCYTIRTTPALKNIPVIIYSATYTSSSDEDMAMEIGANKFIRKPASMNELVSAVQSLLSSPQTYTHKIPSRPKSLDATRQYNKGLIDRLEERNLELIEAKEKLEQSEARLKEAQAIGHIGNWEIDLVSNTQTWSDEIYSIYGTDKRESHPSVNAFLSFMHKEDFELASKNIEQALALEKNDSFNYRFIRKDGAVRYGYSEWKFEFNEVGKPVRLFGITQDVTEKKVAEQEKEFDRNNLYSLINNTNDVMWSVSKDLKLITANHAFDEMVKALSGRLPQRGDDVLSSGFSPDQLKRFKQFYHRALAGETFTEIEYNKLPKEFWSEISFYPSWKGGEVIGTACFSRDITSTFKKTRAIKEQNTKLREIAWTQSHEVRGPLARIMGLLNLLGNQSGLKKLDDGVAIIDHLHTSANELDEVIRKIVSKTEEIDS